MNLIYILLKIPSKRKFCIHTPFKIFSHPVWNLCRTYIQEFVIPPSTAISHITTQPSLTPHFRGSESSDLGGKLHILTTSDILSWPWVGFQHWPTYWQSIQYQLSVNNDGVRNVSLEARKCMWLYYCFSTSSIVHILGSFVFFYEWYFF